MKLIIIVEIKNFAWRGFIIYEVQELTNPFPIAFLRIGYVVTSFWHTSVYSCDEG